MFDACQVGVVLRAVLFVEAVVAVGAMFGAADSRDWLRAPGAPERRRPARPRWPGWSSPAASSGCWPGCRRAAQQLSGVALGALAGPVRLRACWRWSTLPGRVPWLASAFAGALLSAALVAALVLRAKGRMPADTTARLSELQARIRPHFLFNTLNSAIALVREDPARAEALLEDLSDLFRHALVEQGESVTLAEEVALARRYLAIEQVRFGERLRVEWAHRPARPAARGCRRCCCSRWWRMRSSTGWSPAPAAPQVKVSTQRRGSMVVIKVTNTVPAGQGRPRPRRGAGQRARPAAAAARRAGRSSRPR